MTKTAEATFDTPAFGAMALTAKRIAEWSALDILIQSV